MRKKRNPVKDISMDLGWNFHHVIPREYGANLRWRRWAINKGMDKGGDRVALLEACRRDLLFYVNTFCWQYNPNKKGEEVGPFISWPFQDVAFKRIVECIYGDSDLVIEKSREMGASWMCLMVMEWLWHFHPWKKFLMISRNAEAVDSEDPDSLFWKIDFMHRHMPEWLMPRMKRVGMYYGNEDNGSTITGQASTGKAGVGGRATCMFVDEFSQIREDYEVLHRTSDTTKCRIFNFTHTDINNAAAELSRRKDIQRLRMHWSEHPEKKRGLYQYMEEGKAVEVFDKEYVFPENFQFVKDGKLRSPWYDEQCVRKGSSRAIAMDLDIDPRGSQSQFFDKTMIMQLQGTYAVPPFWEGDIFYDKDTGKPLDLCKRDGGPLRMWASPGKNCSGPRGKFAMGADISSGTGATNSCLSVINVGTGEKVAEYASPTISSEHLGVLAVALCKVFRDMDGEGALLAWEQQGPGIIFGRRVLEIGYRNIYYRQNDFELAKKLSDTPGWYPSSSNKRVLLEEYRGALSARLFINRSFEALDECLAFRYNASGNVEHGNEMGGNDPSGARVNHGDRVIADALAWKMAKELGCTGIVKSESVNDEPVLGSLAWRRMLADRQEKLAESWA